MDTTTPAGLAFDDAAPAPDHDATARRAYDTGGDVTTALELARALGRTAPSPGTGRTSELWETLASLGAGDVTAARVVEPHLDAIAILRQSATPIADAQEQAWGVFAAEGPGVRLEAVPDGSAWRLDGRKPWCSLADRLDAALVTAWLPDGDRALFAVSLTGDDVSVVPDAWGARGLVDVASGPVDFAGTPARMVGVPGWYLTRPGFAWGGIGVAACWLGGAVGVARAIRERATTREPDQIGLMHLGAVDVALTSAIAVLADAAERVDAGRADGVDGATLALRVRSTVASAVETVLERAAHALGPAPLALDERHARRVADLSLYVRQHHAERDEAAVGRAVVANGARW